MNEYSYKAVSTMMPPSLIQTLMLSRNRNRYQPITEINKMLSEYIPYTKDYIFSNS